MKKNVRTEKKVATVPIERETTDFYDPELQDTLTELLSASDIAPRNLLFNLYVLMDSWGTGSGNSQERHFDHVAEHLRRATEACPKKAIG